MPHAYIAEPGAVVRQRQLAVEVVQHDRIVASWPMMHLDCLVLVGGVHLSTPAMKALLRHRIPVALLSSQGRLIGRLVPPNDGHLERRLRQYQLHEDPAARLELSVVQVRRKLDAMAALLRSYSRNYRREAFAPALDACRRLADRVAQVDSLPRLRGLEGAATARYFAALRHANRSALPFSRRRSRPPTDPVNAMLSFGYTLLAHEISAAIEAIGLDPHLGFYHQRHGNRPALALDLLEPFRHQVIDRLVFRAINRRQFGPGHFRRAAGEGVRLEPDALRAFLAEYEAAMQQPIVSDDDADDHPLTSRDQMRRHVDAFVGRLSGYAAPLQPEHARG